LNYEPSKLIEEAEKAEDTRDTFLGSLDAMIERAHGPAYRSDKNGTHNPDNHEHDFISHVLPQVAFSVPRVNSRGRAGVVSRMIAKAMKYGLNRWAEDQKLNEVIQGVVQDAFFTYGVFLTIYEPAAWSAPYTKANDYEVVHLPVVRRLSPKQFLLDPLCSDWRFARWMGHDCLYDLDELRDLSMDPESGWNQQMVDMLRADGDDVPWRDSNIQKDGIDRNEVVIREIWCPGSYLPGYGPDDGANGKYAGTIYTVAKGQDGSMKDEWVREPRPYFGPPWGMYTLCGMYRVADLPYPLGPLCVQKPSSDAVNDIGRVIDEGVKAYKRYYITDGADVANKQKSAKNGHLYALKGFNKDSLVQVESGGVTEQMLAAYNFRRERLNRTASMSETLRGNAGGSKTATAESIADQANETVVGYYKQRAYGAVMQIFDTAGWYAYNSDKFQIKLGEDAAQELGMQQPVFFGDPQGMMGAAAGLDGPMQIGDYKDVVELTVEPNSMDMVTSAMQKQQGLEMLGTVFPMLQQIPTMPWVPWKDIGVYLADLYNNDSIANWFTSALQGQQMMTGMPAMPGSPQMQMGSGQAMPGQGAQPQKKPTAGGLMGSAGYAVAQRPMEGKVTGQLAGAAGFGAGGQGAAA
jgi:hypothetical protein